MSLQMHSLAPGVETPNRSQWQVECSTHCRSFFAGFGPVSTAGRGCRRSETPLKRGRRARYCDMVRGQSRTHVATTLEKLAAVGQVSARRGVPRTGVTRGGATHGGGVSISRCRMRCPLPIASVFAEAFGRRFRACGLLGYGFRRIVWGDATLDGWVSTEVLGKILECQAIALAHDHHVLDGVA